MDARRNTPPRLPRPLVAALYRSLALLLLAVAPAVTATAEPAGGALAGDRPRVVVSTDIGGSDPDDFQSMVHLLIYADVLDIEGLISSPPGKGRAKHILEVIDAYEKDYPRLKRHSAVYLSPALLRDRTKQGATDPAPKQGFAKPTEGSRWIVERAKQSISHPSDIRPLWILVWGSITDVAQAVHDAPEIKRGIRVYSIGSWNTRQDTAARDHLFKNHGDLWWIECDTTFRGMYQGGRQDGDWGNRAFVAKHVKGHGALGDLFVRKKSDIKMGDTPSVLYLFRGKPNDPTKEHWGGAFVKTDHGPNYWHDNPDPNLCEGNKAGVKTVNRWRIDYLKDWQARMGAGRLNTRKNRMNAVTTNSLHLKPEEPEKGKGERGSKKP